MKKLLSVIDANFKPLALLLLLMILAYLVVLNYRLDTIENHQGDLHNLIFQRTQEVQDEIHNRR